jgi:hypothetical protein
MAVARVILNWFQHMFGERMWESAVHRSMSGLSSGIQSTFHAFRDGQKKLANAFSTVPLLMMVNIYLLLFVALQTLQSHIRQ